VTNSPFHIPPKNIGDEWSDGRGMWGIDEGFFVGRR